MRYFIHMSAAVMILVMVTAVACTKSATPSTGGQPQNQTAGTPDNSGAATTPDGTTSTPDGTTSTPDGTTSTPPDASGAGSELLTSTLPLEWPSDVPIMEGLTVFTANVQKPTGAIIVGVGAEGMVDMDAVQEFYSNLEGWEQDHRIPWQTTGDVRLVKMMRGGNEDLSAQIKKDGEKVGVMFMYSHTGV